jgi:hypothetical protein
MVFYVYLQSSVISDAAAAGSHGMQNFISILRGFLQNCCLLEFYDDRTRSEIKAAVDKLPEDFDRASLKKVFAQLAKLNRFVYCLEPDHIGEKLDLDCVLEQAKASLLQIIVVDESEKKRTPPEDCELAPLSRYHHTLFEETRSSLSSDGRTSVAGAMDEAVFLDKHFLRALRHAGKIELCDRLAGSRFADNYRHTIRALLKWLSNAHDDPANCSIVFHLGEADGKKPAYINSELSSYRAAGPLAATPTEIRYYHTEMPHQRFILTDQFAIEIDRGLDFLDRSTNKNRDVSLNTKSHTETSKLLAAYAGNLARTEVF